MKMNIFFHTERKAYCSQHHSLYSNSRMFCTSSLPQHHNHLLDHQHRIPLFMLYGLEIPFPSVSTTKKPNSSNSLNTKWFFRGIWLRYFKWYMAGFLLCLVNWYLFTHTHTLSNRRTYTYINSQKPTIFTQKHNIQLVYCILCVYFLYTLTNWNWNLLFFHNSLTHILSSCFVASTLCLSVTHCVPNVFRIQDICNVFFSKIEYILITEQEILLK